MTFSKWLDTFLDEKKIDLEQVFCVHGASGWNYIPVECVIEVIKNAPVNEQNGIKSMLIKIDFVAPGTKPVLNYLEHLAKAIAI